MASISLRPLVPDDAPRLAALAARPSVRRLTDHDPGDEERVFRERIGDGDPDHVLAVTATEGDAVHAAAIVALRSRPRRRHTAGLWLLSDPEAPQEAAAVLLDAVLEACDRWLALARLELRAVAGDPRIEALLAPRGFSAEVHTERSLADGEARLDEVLLGRLRPGWTPPPPMPPAPPMPPPRRAPPESARVRQLDSADGDAVAGTMSEPSVMWGTLQTPFMRPAFWIERFERNDPTRNYLFGVEIDGRVVGNAGLHLGPGARRAHVAGVGMGLRLEAQGMGLGTRLLAAVLELSDRRLGLERLELGVYPDNARAVRLYEHHGFVREGTRRAAAFRDGDYVDELAMARFPKETQ